MPHTITTSKNLTLPIVGGDIDAWGPILNTDFTLIDLVLGGTKTVILTGSTSLSAGDIQNTGFVFTGALTGTATITFPTFYGFAVLQNSTTGGYDLICGVSGLTATVGSGDILLIWANGTDFLSLNTLDISGTTGSGSVVLQNSPTIDSPILTGTVAGAATIPNSILVNSSVVISGHTLALGGSLALTATDVSGLAAIATSGSASDLTSGTVPNARLSAIPNSALANSSVTINTHPLSLGGSLSLVASDIGGLAPIATTGSASNLTSGTVPSARMSGSYTGITGLGTLTVGTWNATTIGLAYGGTNSDLSATGGASRVLRQSSVGAAITVSQLSATDITGLAAIATSGSASDLTTGTVPSGRIAGSYTGITGVGTLTVGTWNATTIGLAYGGTSTDLTATGGASQVLRQSSVGAAITVSQLSASDITGLAAIATSGSASDLSSGTVPSGRIAGSYTGLTGVGTLTVGTWNADVIVGQYGGTGVANTGKTITLGGNLTTSGAFSTTLTTTATTNSTLPAGTHTLAGLDVAQTWSAVQQFNDADFVLKGSSSGTLTVKAAAAAGTNTITFPAGTTDFSGTGGASQVVRQSSAGGAITVSQLAFSDISGTIATGQVSGSYTGITGVGTLTVGTWNADVIAGQYGGTGVANTGKTITLGGNLTASGAFATTLTVTATTNSTLPAGTHTLAGLDVAQTWSANQQFNSGNFLLNGSSSGTLTMKPAAAAGSNTLTFPAGTTDFSATGGTSQVVKQTSSGGAFTVAQLAFSDISGTIATGQVSGSYTGITGVGTLTVGTWNATVIAGQYGGTGVANTSKTITLGDNLTTSGAFATTLTVTATTNSTLPAGTHTLAGLDVAQTFTAAQTFNFGADNNLALDKGSVLTTYNIVSLNGSKTLAGAIGLLGGATADPALNYLSASSGSHIFFVNGTKVATLASGGLTLNGSTSGTLIVKPPAAAGSNTLTLPAGTTDFSATGGTNQFVKQASSGAAFTLVKPTTAITATATNDDATAGDLGDYVESEVAETTVTLTSGVSANLTSISLGAGDWEVSGNAFFQPSGGNITAATTATNSVSATFPATDQWSQLAGLATTAGIGFSLWTKRYKLSGTTTIYLLGNAAFASTCKGGGIIKARRAR